MICYSVKSANSFRTEIIKIMVKINFDIDLVSGLTACGLSKTKTEHKTSGLTFCHETFSV